MRHGRFRNVVVDVIIKVCMLEQAHLRIGALGEIGGAPSNSKRWTRATVVKTFWVMLFAFLGIPARAIHIGMSQLSPDRPRVFEFHLRARLNTVYHDFYKPKTCMGAFIWRTRKETRW